MRRSLNGQSSGAESPTSFEVILDEIKRRGNPKALDGMSRFGIQTRTAFGVSIPQLRELAARTGSSHRLAVQLWKTGIHEARILAGMIDDARNVTEQQIDEWAAEFDSWDLVDQCCGNLFDRTPFAVTKAYEWSKREEEFVKRAGFVLMASLAVHDKKAPEQTFLGFLSAIIREAEDERNFVRKAVNWALRQIGKRNTTLNRAATESCKKIQRIDSKPAKWIARDALRELSSVSVQKRLKDATEREPSR